MAETGSELHDKNHVWTAPARADRMLAVLQKSRLINIFFNDFGPAFGLQIDLLGSLWAHDGTFFRRWVRSRCRGYGTRRTSAENQIGAEVKVYLSDKSYD